MSINIIDFKTRINNALLTYLPKTNQAPHALHEAMHYTTIDAGKRIRPLLVYATGNALGIDLDMLDPIACAIECIHAYSLIHDDLPAMDDDDMRRGKPSCHKAFDEATAILAGDALHTLAFDILANQLAMLTAEQQLNIIKTLSKACGPQGMVAGQTLDLALQDQSLTIDTLENIHHLKTGALIHACITCTLHAGNQPITSEWETIGKSLGLAFQIQDDLLDFDEKSDEVNIVRLLGVDKATDKLSALTKTIDISLNSINGDTRLLSEFIGYIIQY